jgi:hypothetical protein
VNININLKLAVMKNLFTMFVLVFIGTIAYSQTITWAYLQWEASLVINEGESFEAGAVVFADGLTNAVDSETGEGITADIGYSSSDTDPSSDGWIWQSVPFNADWGDNFYYQGFLNDVPAGEYFYTFRFQLDDGPYAYAGTDGLWNGTSSVSKAFTVNTVTGITSDEFKTPSISVYPNPVNTTALIWSPAEARGSSVFIYDLQGRLLKTMAIQSAETSVDMSGWAPGIYLFEHIGNKFNQTHKVIKN